MYEHDEDHFANYSSESRILDEVHHLVIVDVFLEIIIFLFAGISNLALIIVEIKSYLKTGSMSLPRQLIFWLAWIDSIGVFVGLLPRLLVQSVKPCPEYCFAVIHMLTVTFQCFAILMSKLTVVLMGIERYMSLLRPFFYVRTCNSNRFLFLEIMCCIYSAMFAATSSFFNFYHYHDTEKYYLDIDHENCHEMFLIFEFGSINHNVDFPWRYAEICGSFQFYQLAQDILLIIVLIICNSAVIKGLKVMDDRMKKVCPQPNTADKSPSTPLSYPGRDFARLMTLINVFVLLLTTPQMVR